MWFVSEKTVQKLFEGLGQLPLTTSVDREYRDLYMDQLGSSVNNGGRSILVIYIYSIYLLPKIIRSLPSHTIRIPMSILLLTQGENIYFYGAQIAIKYTSGQIINQMNTLPLDSQLKQLAQSIDR